MVVITKTERKKLFTFAKKDLSPPFFAHCVFKKNKFVFELCRPLVKSEYQKNNFLISQPKYMLWILKRTVSMRGSFEHPEHMLKIMGKKIFTILR